MDVSDLKVIISPAPASGAILVMEPKEFLAEFPHCTQFFHGHGGGWFTRAGIETLHVDQPETKGSKMGFLVEDSFRARIYIVPKVVVTRPWHSFGYTPTFHTCPHCGRETGYFPLTSHCGSCIGPITW